MKPRSLRVAYAETYQLVALFRWCIHLLEQPNHVPALQGYNLRKQCVWERLLESFEQHLDACQREVDR